MKINITVIILATIGIFSCKQVRKSTPKTLDKESLISLNNVQNDNIIYTKYDYVDSKGGNLIILNSFPKGGTKYTDPEGKEYYYAVFFTRIINKTDKPIKFNINFSDDSYELPSLLGRYFKLLLPLDTMTHDKEPLSNYGLKDLESFLDNNRHKSSLLNRTINPKESSGFYVVKLNIKPKSGWQVNGKTRAGFSLKKQNLFYTVNDKEIQCGNINIENLKLKK